MADAVPLRPIRASDLPELPRDHLPAALRDLVKEVSDTVDVDISMPCIMATTLLASIYQSRIEVAITPEYVEPICIYSSVLANPGERKTSSMNAVLGCVRKASVSLHTYWKTEQAVREHTIRNSKEMVEAILEDPSTASADNPALQKAIANANLTPGLKQFILEDMTPAAFIQSLSISPTALILSDEGEVWKKLSGGTGEDIGLWLRAHTGETYIKNRKTQEPVYIERPVASVLLAMQPGIIRSSSNIRGLSDQGLVARFIWCIAKSRIGQRLQRLTRPSEEVTAAFNEWSKRISVLIADHRSKKPDGSYKTVTTLTMTDDALAIWQQWAAFIEYELRSEMPEEVPVIDRLPPSVAIRMSIGNAGGFRRISAAASKAAGATARIAAASCADRIYTGGEAAAIKRVTGPEMLAAIEFMSAQMEHTKAVRALLDGEDAEDQFAIIEHFNENGWPDTCKKGWLVQVAKDICQNRDSAEAAIDHLVERGYFHTINANEYRRNEHLPSSTPPGEAAADPSTLFPPA